MRRLFARGPIVKEVRRRALSEEKGPRGGKMQICANCGKSFAPKDLQCDHREEVVRLDSSAKEMTLDEYALRLYCQNEMDGPVNFDNLQMLCLDCHKMKTTTENVIRTRFKKEKKDEMQKLQQTINKKRKTKK